MEDLIQDAKKKQTESEDEQSRNRPRSARRVNLDQLAASSEEAPVIKLANLIVVQAIKDRASDIHLEPSRNRCACATALTAC